MAKDLQVIAFTSAGRVVPPAGVELQMVDGDVGLVQMIYKNLHTVPGDDEFDPAWGSGLFAALSGKTGADTADAAQIAANALSKAVLDLGPTYPGLRLRLTDITFNQSALEWALQVTLSTAAGDRALSF